MGLAVDLEWLLSKYGYFALFAVFSLGLVGLPIPNEVVVMTGGAASSGGLLLSPVAFFSSYAGICCGLTVGYVIGRFVGKPILVRIGRKPKFEKYIAKSQELVGKYGKYSLLFTYFIPVVRNLMPYVFGANGMSYATFALFAYSGAFLWTTLFFCIGYFAEDQLDAETIFDIEL